jgi:membrane protein DedA with SNARE-associated domain
MPICAKCRMAYLDGESHRCERKASSGVGAIAGAITGAVVGSLAIFAVYGVLSGSNLSGLVGILVGGPLGAVVGSLISAYGGRNQR